MFFQLLRASSSFPESKESIPIGRVLFQQHSLVDKGRHSLLVGTGPTHSTIKWSFR